MQEEQLRSCLAVITREERLDTANREQVVEILQTDFRDVRLPTECTWHMAVIPNGDREFRGIGLVEVL